MPKLGIVTDSTCDLGPEWLTAHEVEMVPLKVLFGTESFHDWLDLSPEAFYRKLEAADTLPKTSQPSPGEFEEVYRRLAEEGCDGIVSIHLSSKLSGTYESATLASAESSIPVRLVDSLTASQATGLVVKAAIDARDAGRSLDEVQAAADKAVTDVRLYFVLETLEYLVKGGRAGKAQALAASLLNIKPVLETNDEGIVAPVKKVRGMQQALEEIATMLTDDTAGKSVV